MTTLSLTHTAAQRLMLAAQGLAQRPKQAATKADVLATIRRMGVLQIDTINVVARSPYLVLWSRLANYQASWLDELLSEGALFEYWSHEACFLPIEDYPLYRHRMIDPGSLGWKYSHSWITEHRTEVERVLEHIRVNGPTRSADFIRKDGKGGGWWGWKPEKRALEMLFSAGELMICRRHNFQRVYDLRERVLPSWQDSQLPDIAETRRTLALKAVRALGITTEKWLSDYFRTKKEPRSSLLSTLAEEGLLLPVKVADWNGPAYIHPDNLMLANKAANGALTAELTTLLSPFDPLVWDRARARAMFNFDYTIECYTPAAKRCYGYFTLPILHHGQLIGRLDPKAHRQEGYFEIKAIYLEKGVPINDELIDDLASTLQECARWHKTPEVVIGQSSPKKLAAPLRRAIKQK
ncbi:MAG: crosslink repair DNA glycosylase YcaQ family protein [Acidobacteriota bacterium]